MMDANDFIHTIKLLEEANKQYIPTTTYLFGSVEDADLFQSYMNGDMEGLYRTEYNGIVELHELPE